MRFPLKVSAGFFDSTYFVHTNTPIHLSHTKLHKVGTTHNSIFSHIDDFHAIDSANVPFSFSYYLSHGGRIPKINRTFLINSSSHIWIPISFHPRRPRCLSVFYKISDFTKCCKNKSYSIRIVMNYSQGSSKSIQFKSFV